MKVWLPYTHGGSGTDVFTQRLAQGLASAGCNPVVQAFPHKLQYAPSLLRAVPPPPDTLVTVANTWNAFAFRRRGVTLVAVEHLFVLDPAAAPYKTTGQKVFHELLVRQFEQATHRNADAVVAVSRYTASAYSDGLHVAPPRVIINGIDTEFFCPESNLQEKIYSSERPFRLLFVGNMTRRKGADMIPRIVKRLGDGFEISYTTGLRVADPFPGLPNTRKLGKLTQEGVRAEYRRADALLFPTRLEGLPLVAIEAMACGTPVIACRTASLPEVVEHERNGMLCTLDDPNSFASAIVRLRDDPPFLAQLGKNAYTAAQEKFSLTRMVQGYLELFSEITA